MHAAKSMQTLCYLMVTKQEPYNQTGQVTDSTVLHLSKGALFSKTRIIFRNCLIVDFAKDLQAFLASADADFLASFG